MWREGDDYFLKTPAEKVRIQVEDLPFIVIGWALKDDGYIEIVTNTDERYKLSEMHPLIIAQDAPAIKVRDGFLARVHRNVYYQWAELASPAVGGEEPGFYLQSADMRFFLGPAS